MAESRDSDRDQVEIRFYVNREVADAMDALGLADGLTRGQQWTRVATEKIHATRHLLSVVRRVMRGYPHWSDGQG